MTKLPLSLLALCSLLYAAPVPSGWGDFQFGMVESRREPWKGNMIEAINAGVKLDRRWIYATNPDEVTPGTSSSFLFASWYNYSKDPVFLSKGVRPTLTVYMLQNGEDGLEAVHKWAADKAYMTKYFNAVKSMVDSSKGTQPIYVLEPDAWSYLIQNTTDKGEANLNSLCHINDLGIPELSGFKNQIRDLPKALNALIKSRDPSAYVGLLLAHWAYLPAGANGALVNQDDATVLAAAAGGVEFVKKFYDNSAYAFDFLALEKNGTDAGSYGPGSEWYWNDAQNAKYLKWSQALSQGLNKPLLGWQICAGHMGLANTTNSYEDTFFPYFFSHKQDFINAGWIGMMAGCNNQGKGTTPQISGSTAAGDGGWFYNQLAQFNAGRPYLSANSAVLPQSHLKLSLHLNQLRIDHYQGFAKILGADGKVLKSWIQGNEAVDLELAAGHYVLQTRLGVQNLTLP